MEARLSIVTLGVADVARARRFYEAVGFRAAGASNEHVTFFDAGGVVLALFGRHALAEDAAAGALRQEGGFPGVTLAHNVRSEQAVRDVLAQAEAAGARVVKPAQKTFWGGYSGYFADPDGHHWEVAHNPFFPMDMAGRLQLP